MSSDAASVVVVGGGLSGLAAAVALASSGCRVKLLEARRSLGGRAASFRDPASDELVDHCQHVSMGCCTTLADFCRRTGIAEFFRRDRVLTFIGPNGRQHCLAATRWLPAPLHLAPGFLRLSYLSLGERARIGLALWKLMRTSVVDDPAGPTVGQWLEQNGQSPNAVELFWSVILVSALGENLDRASLAAARKVLVDGFLASREAYVVEVPEAPLSTLYGERLTAWLKTHDVTLHLSTPVRRVSCDASPRVVADGMDLRPDYVVVALPWTKVVDIIDPLLAATWPCLAHLGSIQPAPITGVHLWFDRPIMDLPHAVLVGRQSQWIFNRNWRQPVASGVGHYYQVVISGSRELVGRDRDDIAGQVRRELAAVWPAAATATLLRARVVTDPSAVFSVRPGLDQIRPPQQTPTPGILLAGDWTATGWPSTMESAVRSGYLAAESILKSLGRPQTFVAPDLPRSPLSRLLIGGR